MCELETKLRFINLFKMNRTISWNVYYKSSKNMIYDNTFKSIARVTMISHDGMNHAILSKIKYD